MSLFNRISDSEKNSAIVRVQQFASSIYGADTSETVSIVRSFTASLKNVNSVSEINRLTEDKINDLFRVSQ